MAHSKIWLSYPPAFFELLREAATRECVLDLPDERSARRLMGKLYALKGALKKAKAYGRKVVPMSDEDLKMLDELYPLAVRVQLRVEPHAQKVGAWSLIARPFDTDPDNLLVMDALKRALPGTSQSDIPLPSPGFFESLKTETKENE